MPALLVVWLFFSTTLLPFTVAVKNPKRGIAFAEDIAGDIVNANQSYSVVSWVYDWASVPHAYLEPSVSHLKFIPMQWGAAQIDQFADEVKAQGANTVLTFNEPDFQSQANIAPEEAALLWMQYIEPLKATGVRLGSPAVTSTNTGRAWLQAFFTACCQCTIDFLPLHWYGTGIGPFYDYVWSMHGEFPDLPIWVTEFADTSTNATEVADFMNQTITYLDGLEWVEAYAWFGFFRPQPGVNYNLLDDTGALNNLGRMYVGTKTS